MFAYSRSFGIYPYADNSSKVYYSSRKDEQEMGGSFPRMFFGGHSPDHHSSSRGRFAVKFAYKHTLVYAMH